MNDQIDLEDPRVVARVRAKAHQLARTLGSHHDVEDLQQELLLRMCLKSILYDPERSNPWTFITVLLESIAAKLLRHYRAACRDRHRLCSVGLEFLSQADRRVDDATLHLDLLEVIHACPSICKTWPNACNMTRLRRCRGIWKFHDPLSIRKSIESERYSKTRDWTSTDRRRQKNAPWDSNQVAFNPEEIVMPNRVYRYTFLPTVEFHEVETSLALAILATQNLHGEAQLRLDARYSQDRSARVIVVDASTPVGCDLNRLFVGFVQRELGERDFRVERIDEAGFPTTRPAA